LWYPCLASPSSSVLRFHSDYSPAALSVGLLIPSSSIFSNGNVFMSLLFLRGGGAAPAQCPVTSSSPVKDLAGCPLIPQTQLLVAVTILRSLPPSHLNHPSFISMYLTPCRNDTAGHVCRWQPSSGTHHHPGSLFMAAYSQTGSL
jgi:hypothetical protein